MFFLPIIFHITSTLKYVISLLKTIVAVRCTEYDILKS